MNNEHVHEFKTFLPIQLDGTCNGFQHLALLSNETKLFENLNLAKANKSDKPKDFYQSVIDQLNIYLEEKKNSSNDPLIVESCVRLIKLNINRSNIKTAIMTIPYNATSTSLVAYIIQSLEYYEQEKKEVLDQKGDGKAYMG
jgi:DNA-directed RNA polymerase